MAKAYQAKATMLVVRVPGAQGGEVYLRQGRKLPASVEGSEIKRLLARGLIEEAADEDTSTGTNTNLPTGGNQGGNQNPPASK